MYKDYTNFPTWAFNNYYHNDSCMRQYLNGMALKFWTAAESDHSWVKMEKAIMAFGDWLKGNAWQTMPRSSVMGLIWGELLLQAYESVNWYEIAGQWLQKYKDVAYESAQRQL